MKKFLPIDNIVSNTATSVKEKFSLNKLNTLLIVNGPTQPHDELETYYNTNELLQKYGLGDVYDWSTVFFGVTSKNATKPDFLSVYNWYKNDIPAALVGGRCSDIAILKTLKGGFNIEIGTYKYSLSLDLTGGEIVSYDNVANALQAALQAVKIDIDGTETTPPEFLNATCVYSIVNNGFIIKSGVKGIDSKISFATPPSSETDISLQLGLSQASKAFTVNGINGIPTLQVLLENIKQINGDYYVITTNFTFDNENEDLLTFGKFVNDSNNDYLGIYNWANPKLGVIGSGAISQIQGFNGLYIDYKHSYTQNAVSAGLISSMDLSATNGNYNINFNTFSSFENESITEQAEFDGMVSNKSNAFYTIGVKGKNTTYYGQGLIMGDLTNLANVYLCNSYLKFQKQIAVSNMFDSQALIPLRGGSTEGIVRGFLDAVYESAVKSGIIVQGVIFNVSEKQTIISTFENSEDAIKQLQNFGYYYVISRVDTTNATIYITDAYVANKATNKIIINTYILGA